MAKGFKKNGKFRPTGNRNTSVIHSSDVNQSRVKVKQKHPSDMTVEESKRHFKNSGLSRDEYDKKYKLGQYYDPYPNGEDRFGNPVGTKYDIVRFYREDGKPSRVIKRNVNDIVAHTHVNDPKTRKEGVYFDGFRKR